MEHYTLVQGFCLFCLLLREGKGLIGASLSKPHTWWCLLHSCAVVVSPA